MQTVVLYSKMATTLASASSTKELITTVITWLGSTGLNGGEKAEDDIGTSIGRFRSMDASPQERITVCVVVSTAKVAGLASWLARGSSLECWNHLSTSNTCPNYRFAIFVYHRRSRAGTSIYPRPTERPILLARLLKHSSIHPPIYTTYICSIPLMYHSGRP